VSDTGQLIKGVGYFRDLQRCWVLKRSSKVRFHWVQFIKDTYFGYENQNQSIFFCVKSHPLHLTSRHTGTLTTYIFSALSQTHSLESGERPIPLFSLGYSFDSISSMKNDQAWALDDSVGLHTNTLCWFSLYSPSIW